MPPPKKLSIAALSVKCCITQHFTDLSRSTPKEATLFITFEGPDGSGKTTQIKKLVPWLQEKGFDVITTREPGGTPISDQVRDVIMNMKNKSMFPRTEILLFCSSRAQLVEELIRPSLAQGKIIISDRYADSTLAYQGYGHGFDQQELKQLLDFATGGLWPDLTLLLELDAETGLRRRITNHEEWNRMDDYQIEFHKRVRQGYHEMAAKNPSRWITIDATRDPDLLQSDIRRILEEKLRKC